MRTIRRSSAFKRDARQVLANSRYKDVAGLLQVIVDSLAADQRLPAANRDHALSGDWMSYRECHVRPDLLLIYRKPDADTLHLARLGSHSDLFG